MDEFHDEQKFKELNEREVAAWLEVFVNTFINSMSSYELFSSLCFMIFLFLLMSISVHLPLLLRVVSWCFN